MSRQILKTTSAPAIRAQSSEEEELKAFLVSFGYSLEATKSYRRIFSQEVNSSGDKSPEVARCQFQLYCGRIPSEVDEQELFELFHSHGKIQEICLMLDAATQRHRGFAFVMFFDEETRKLAIEKLNNHEIRAMKRIKLTEYRPNRSLYIGNIPKSKDRQELLDEFKKQFDGVADVIVYRPLSNCRLHDQNRGFCFVEFDTHELARAAKRAIERESIKLFGCAIFVDWADSLHAPDDSIMQSVRVLYVRNVHESVTELQLRRLFCSFGEIERVKKIKNFAFVHFDERNNALRAMSALQNLELCGERLTILLAYPPLDKKKKEEMLRIRQERVFVKENPIRIRY